MTDNDTIERTTMVNVQHWHNEGMLKAVVIFVSLIIWVALTVTIVGILYALFIAITFFLIHVGFITYLRGSAVKLGPEQFPDLYKRVRTLVANAGLRKMPDVYLMQAGGSLNAMATKFLKSHMIILYSDLLEACGDNNDARDMIIGHEIGHLKAGHLDWFWFMLPGMFFPLLGQAYSRAREYTCDRYGYELCENKQNGIQGLVILAVGKKFAGNVKLTPFLTQKRDLDTAWMTLGRWFSGYPPIVDRIAALDKNIPGSEVTYSKGSLQATIILLMVFIVPLAAALFGLNKISSIVKNKAGILNSNTTSNDYNQGLFNALSSDSTDNYNAEETGDDSLIDNTESESMDE